MKCKSALVVLVAAFAAISALAGSNPQDALADPPSAASVIEAPDSWEPIEELLTGKITGTGGFPGAMADAEQLYDAAGGSGGTYNTARAKLIVGQITEVADEAGVGGLGVSGVLPIFAQGAGAFAIGWTTGSLLDHWLGISNYFGPDPETPGDGYQADGDWLYGSCENTAPVGTTGSWVPGASTTNYGNKYHDTNLDAACTNVDLFFGVGPDAKVVGWLGVLERTTGVWDSNYCDAVEGGGSQDSLQRTEMRRLATVLGVTSADVPNLGGCAPGYRGALWATPAQMAQLRGLAGPVVTTPPGGSVVEVPRPTKIESAADDCVFGSDCWQQIIDKLNDGSHDQSRDWIVHEIDPGDFPDDPAVIPPFELPVPNPNEVYDDYVGRLVAAGYLGSVTRVDEATPVDGYGPLSPTRILYHPRSAPDTIKVADPLNWPFPGPSISPDTDITVRVNPDDVPPVGDSGGGSCSCPPLDFSPLQGLDVGNSFPFGALNWFKNAMGTPSASNLDFTLHLPIGDQDINTESAWWEDNRDTYYPIEEFLITVAFFFVFATRILHLGKADED
jgi:hypothetical protein